MWETIASPIKPYMYVDTPKLTTKTDYGITILLYSYWSSQYALPAHLLEYKLYDNVLTRKYRLDDKPKEIWITLPEYLIYFHCNLNNTKGNTLVWLIFKWAASMISHASGRGHQQSPDTTYT